MFYERTECSPMIPTPCPVRMRRSNHEVNREETAKVSVVTFPTVDVLPERFVLKYQVRFRGEFDGQG